MCKVLRTIHTINMGKNALHLERNRMMAQKMTKRYVHKHAQTQTSLLSLLTILNVATHKKMSSCLLDMSHLQYATPLQSWSLYQVNFILFICVVLTVRSLMIRIYFLFYFCCWCWQYSRLIFILFLKCVRKVDEMRKWHLVFITLFAIQLLLL